MYREQAPDEEPPAVRWLPFQLNPDLPEEGISRQAYIERKWGPAGNKYERVAAVGREVGIDFAFSDIKVQPNTVNAHRLMLYGAKHGHEDEVAESLFAGYFKEGANLTDRKTLADIGERARDLNATCSKTISTRMRTRTRSCARISRRAKAASAACRFLFSTTRSRCRARTSPRRC